MRKIKIIDPIQNILFFVVVTLIFSGGIYGKIEISQVDVFGWLLLVTVLLRQKVADAPFSGAIQEIIGSIMDQADINGSRLFRRLLIIVSIVYIFVQKSKFDSFDSNAFDLSYVEHGIWAFAKYGLKLPFLYSTISRSGSYLSEHFSPIFITLSPLYLIDQSIMMMFIGQSILISLAALLLYHLSRRKMDGKNALFVCLLFLMYQPLRAAWGFDFREDIFFLPILFGLFLAIENKSKAMTVLLSLSLFAVKENGGILLFLTGVCFYKKNRLTSLLMMFAGFIGFLIISFKIMPMFAVKTNDSVMMSRLGILGFDQAHPLQSLISNFGTILKNIFTQKLNIKTFKYLLLVFTPFAVVIWKSRKNSVLILFSIAAILGLNILISPQTVGFHYECVLIPFLFLLMIDNYNEIKTKLAVVFCCFLCTYGRSPVLEIRKHIPTTDDHCLELALKSFGPELSITTQSALHPHLLKRLAIQNLGDVHEIRGDYVVLTRSLKVNQYASNTVHEVFEKDTELGLNKIHDTRLLTVWTKNGVNGDLVSKSLKELSCLN